VWLVQADKPRISIVLAAAEDGFELQHS